MQNMKHKTSYHAIKIKYTKDVKKYQICVDVHVREVSDINNVSICVLDPAPAGVVLVVVVAVAAAGLEVEPDLATVCQDWK